jgi:hypothetical protein
LPLISPRATGDALTHPALALEFFLAAMKPTSEQLQKARNVIVTGGSQDLGTIGSFLQGIVVESWPGILKQHLPVSSAASAACVCACAQGAHKVLWHLARSETPKGKLQAKYLFLPF